MFLSPFKPIETISEIESCNWFNVTDKEDVYCINPLRFTVILASRVEERIAALLDILRATNLETAAIKVYVSDPEAREIYSRVFPRVKPIGTSDDDKAELVIVDCSDARCETETIFSIIVREAPTPVIIAANTVPEPRELTAKRLMDYTYRVHTEKIEVHAFFAPVAHRDSIDLPARRGEAHGDKP